MERVCGIHSVYVQFRGELVLFPPCGFWGVNSDHWFDSKCLKLLSPSLTILPLFLLRTTVASYKQDASERRSFLE